MQVKGAARPWVAIGYMLMAMTAISPATSAPQAAGTGGALQGVVTDPSGALVPSAQVNLSNGGTGFNQSAATGPDGIFHFLNVPPNNYRLDVAAPGFQAYSQTVDVRTSVPLQLKVQLALPNQTQTVTVSATPETIENVPVPHTDVSEQMIADLPLTGSGQGLSQAITLTTGAVVADSNGFFHPQGDHGQTSYVVDGQRISDQQNKTFSTQMPANIFQSMELVTNSPSAEYGGKTSLVVNAQTKSGLGSRPSASLDLTYGSFGTLGENATFAVGGAKWGNFFAADGSRSGRFLDSPEFQPFHDIGNTESLFDRLDVLPSPHDAIHLDLFGARNWFQVPVTYDQIGQDQRQQAETLNVSLGYQHTFSSNSLLSIYPFLRQDRIGYFPSSDAFADTPATIAQNRHLTNFGARADYSFVDGINNVKVGTELMRTDLIENFSFGLTDPTFNVPGTAGFAPGLLPFDLTRGGTYFNFHGSASINEESVYAEDQLTWKGMTFTPGLRYDNYDGISQDHMVEPRIGLSYLVKKTQTVLRGSYDRTMETPYNENLVLSSSTGVGGLASNAFGERKLVPGHRSEYNLGFEQAAGKFVTVSATYFWKITDNAFDFDTLFNTPVAFPIEWRQSRIDGLNGTVATRKMHGLQAYTSFGHTRARFFGPEVGGLIFNSPLDAGVFRIDHDQVFQSSTFVRYQPQKEGFWTAFTWRFDSGEVAAAIAGVEDAVNLDADQQASIGFHCGSQRATLGNPITSCNGPYGATRLSIPPAGQFNPDTHPTRIAPRSIFDASLGYDNLFHHERLKTNLKLTATNLTNEAALYNFLSTFSGTHWLSPRSVELTLGWVY